MGIGALLCAAALLLPRARAQRLHGAPALFALVLLAAYTAISIIWSLAPSDSWIEANRTFAYLSAFAGTIALARLAPGNWPAVLHGIALACVAVSTWALLTKIFPGALAEDETYARLRAPFDYWNSVGLTAAIGVLALLWLGARRSGRAAVNALAWPGIALLEVALMLSYSRGALLALVAGLAFWFAVVPLRLRGAVVLLGATAGAAALVALGVHDDGTEHRPPAARAARRRRPRARCAAAAAAGAAARGRPRRGLPERRAAGLPRGQAGGGKGPARRARRDPGDPARRARERPGRRRRPGVEGLGPAHQPQRGDAGQHAEPPDRHVLGARALLGGGVRRARRLALGRHRRRRLRDGAQPLQDRDAVRAPRPRLRAPDDGGPRLGGARAVAARALPLGLGRAAHRRDPAA